MHHASKACAHEAGQQTAEAECSAGTDAEQAGLTVPAFFQALHVVFLHENFLLTLRQLAFGGRSQSRESCHADTPAWLRFSPFYTSFPVH